MQILTHISQFLKKSIWSVNNVSADQDLDHFWHQNLSLRMFLTNAHRKSASRYRLSGAKHNLQTLVLNNRKLCTRTHWLRSTTWALEPGIFKGSRCDGYYNQLSWQAAWGRLVDSRGRTGFCSCGLQSPMLMSLFLNVLQRNFLMIWFFAVPKIISHDWIAWPRQNKAGFPLEKKQIFDPEQVSILSAFMYSNEMHEVTVLDRFINVQ